MAKISLRIGRRKNAGAKRGVIRPTKRAASRPITRPLQQGVGAVTRRPFGSTKRMPGAGVKQFFNALSPAHLPLPRAVGPYQVVRFTTVYDPSDSLCCFGFMRVHDVNGVDQWLASAGVSSVNGAVAINGNQNTRYFQLSPMDFLYSSCSVAPHAMTIQVMNADAIQTTTGILQIGRSTSQYNLGGSSRSWNALASEFISYQSPRLVSAAKLALTGVKVDAMPLDMQELADFTPLARSPDYPDPFTWDSDTLRFAGTTPIVVVNSVPGNNDLRILVTTEWKVRFDPGNPAAASHTFHQPGSLSTWTQAVQAASSAGHGVEDISEHVAEAGAIGYGAVEALGALAAF